MKHNVANFLINDLSGHNLTADGANVNSGVISDIVDGWDRKVYIVPAGALRLNHGKKEKYLLM